MDKDGMEMKIEIACTCEEKDCPALLSLKNGILIVYNGYTSASIVIPTWLEDAILAAWQARLAAVTF